MEMKRWNRMIPSFWGFDIPITHHHLHRTPRLERPSAPEMPTNQCYKGRKCSPPLAPQRSASIQRGREEDYTPENYDNMLAINDSKPSWLYNMPKKNACFLPSCAHPTNMESDADRWPNYMEGSFLVYSEFHGFHRVFFTKNNQFWSD